MKAVKRVLPSVNVQMGPHEIGQPLPTNKIDQYDPFLLLHHFGPKKLSPESEPFYVGAHPHRGFEPITFVYQGAVEHKDSLGNHKIIDAGGVQWLTAGRGIVHAEGAPDTLVVEEGTIEIIQLWVNLPSSMKMNPANYQPFQKNEMPLVTVADGLGQLQVISGAFKELNGPVDSLTGITAYNLNLKQNASLELEFKAGEQVLIYQLHGHTRLNGIEILSRELVAFKLEGTKIQFKTELDSQYLVLSGIPIEENVVSWGPYVMNSQTEILEALRDYQMGKMGMMTH